jgi:hypothetical protein
MKVRISYIDRLARLTEDTAYKNNICPRRPGAVKRP